MLDNNTKIKGIIQIISVIVLTGLILFLLKNIRLEYLIRYGYIGAFVVSLLSSATLILPAPGAALVVAMSAYLNPIILGIVAGIGSGIGDITGYWAGQGGHKVIKDRIDDYGIKDFVDRFGVFAIFILAFIPSPFFDIAGIVSGALRVPWRMFLLATVSGRILRYIVLSWIGGVTLGSLVL